VRLCQRTVTTIKRVTYAVKSIAFRLKAEATVPLVVAFRLNAEATVPLVVASAFRRKYAI